MNLDPNILSMVQLLKSGNPKEVAMQIIQKNFASDPTMQSLIQMAESGNEQGIKQFATNFFNSQGKDFNTEMNNFMSTIKSM